MPAAWAPTVDDVAALLQARLAKRGGGMATTFDDTTRPTGTQVEALIERGVQAVADRVGTTLCDNAELQESAGAAAAIYTAMLIEQSYYPGQTRDAGSSFQSLLALWRDDIKALDSRVAEECGEGGAGGTTGDNRTGLGYFDTVPLIGRSYPDW